MRGETGFRNWNGWGVLNDKAIDILAVLHGERDVAREMASPGRRGGGDGTAE